MFDWFRKRPVALDGTWNVAPSPDHTYVVFGDARLPARVAAALAELDASLAEASRENRSDASDDPAFLDDYDEEGKVRAIIASHVTVEPVTDVAAARDASIDPTAVADATHAVRVGAHDLTQLDFFTPYALLGAAAAIARAANGLVSDTLGLRFVPDGLIADPFEAMPLGSVGPHVTVVSTNDPDGTLRFTTIGLEKFGLFDVTLGGVPASLPRASDIVAGFAQELVPDDPLQPGPWKPPLCYVSYTSADFFYDRSEGAPKTYAFVHLTARPIPGESRVWAIAGEKRARDAGWIAAALKQFDADRAAGAEAAAAKAGA